MTDDLADTSRLNSSVDRADTDPIVPLVFDTHEADFRSSVVERSKTTPVLVDFWAAWCGPCRALGPILEKLAEEYAGGFVLAKVDTEREQGLAAQFKIRSIPTVMLFRNGDVVTGFQGALPEGQIRRFLTQQGIEAGGAAPLTLPDEPVARVAALREAITAHPSRDALKLELAEALVAAGEFDEAARQLEGLPSALYQDARALRARAQVALSRPQPTSVQPGVAAILGGEIERGIALLLEQLREEQGHAERPAKQALVDAIPLITDEALVRDTRRRMASLLF